ncbi:MAG: DUF1080 domain-containing protein [bacterium]
MNMKNQIAATVIVGLATVTFAGEPKVFMPVMPTYKVGEWNSLFNGKDFTGWGCRDYQTHAWKSPEGRWKVEDGTLRVIGEDLWTIGRFGDFELEVEFRHDPQDAGSEGNSGIFLRRDSDDWCHTSFEIQVLKSYDHNPPDKHDCGALYDCVAPAKNALTKRGEWQKYHITFKGNLLTVLLNNEKIIDVNLDDWKEARKNPDGSPNKFRIAYKDMAKDGHIGLQCHCSPIMYRNIRIKPLTEPKPPVENPPALAK